ncbi:hypothetical protein [Nonomuraea roseola]|uniref:Uncharacterized protein n=1 Tax=Nonomuraea roseola TaxID=46179 RepID=A0ABV5PTS6_9ACTN
MRLSHRGCERSRRLALQAILAPALSLVPLSAQPTLTPSRKLSA